MTKPTNKPKQTTAMTDNKTIDQLHKYCARCRHGRIIDGSNFRCECKDMTTDRLAAIAVNLFLDEEICPEHQPI